MSNNHNLIDHLKQLIRVISGVMLIIVMLVFGVIGMIVYPEAFQTRSQESATVSESTIKMANTEIKEGIHVRTGLLDGNGLKLVIQNCTSCHSAKLISQNRMSYEGWKSTIKWMQQTQNLWDLGENEEIILTYLAKNYAPEEKGRRTPLTDIEWYELK